MVVQVIISKTLLSGVYLVDMLPFIDERGAFFRSFCKLELKFILGSRQIVQINQSMTRQVGSVRGLHFQRAPHREMKLVRCIKGRIWDVAVDLRVDSQTYLQNCAVELTAENASMFIIPEGCAHGFQVLEQDSEILYLHTHNYEPNYEGGIHHNDPKLGITWPLPVSDVSKRDLDLPFFNSEFHEKYS